MSYYTRDWVPFPMHTLPKELRQCVKEIADTKCCDNAAIVTPLLPALGTAIGSSADLQLNDDWTETANIWATLIEKSGGGKSNQMKTVWNPLFQIQEEWLEEHERMMEGRDPNSDEEIPPPRRLITSNTTAQSLLSLLAYNPRNSIGVYKDELGQWAESFNQFSNGGGDCQVWLETHRKTSSFIDLKSERDKQNPFGLHQINGAVTSICGAIPPNCLNRLMTEKMIEAGLWQRFLLAQPPQRRRKWRTQKGTYSGYLAQMFDQLLKLDVGERLPLTLTNEAQAEFIAYWESKDPSTDDSDDFEFSINQKYISYAARIALVLHLVKYYASTESNVPVQVDLNSMRSGITIAEWYRNEALRLREIFGHTKEELAALNFLNKTPNEGQPAYKLAKASRVFKTVEDADKALTVLVNQNLATRIHREHNGSPGRPSDAVYRIIPNAVSPKYEDSLDSDGFVATGGIQNGS